MFEEESSKQLNLLSLVLIISPFGDSSLVSDFDIRISDLLPIIRVIRSQSFPRESLHAPGGCSREPPVPKKLKEGGLQKEQNSKKMPGLTKKFNRGLRGSHGWKTVAFASVCTLFPSVSSAVNHSLENPFTPRAGIANFFLLFGNSSLVSDFDPPEADLGKKFNRGLRG
jgi:hypothetical protein